MPRKKKQELPIELSKKGLEKIANQIAMAEKMPAVDCKIIVPDDFSLECQGDLERIKKSMEKINGVAGNDFDCYDEAFRAAHSLKSICFISGFKGLSKLARNLENIFYILRAGCVCLTERGKEGLRNVIANFSIVLKENIGKKISPKDFELLEGKLNSIWPPFV
ncbi:Hpt domain-containing protein [Candidatus Falkowbacteria bacterium]|nr:Hpt domain-containing protein [Candidatus Falkowbacteria bacterium]